MRCPNCGSENLERYRRPKIVQGVVLRRHRCLVCGELCLSAQVLVEGELTARFLELLEK